MKPSHVVAALIVLLVLVAIAERNRAVREQARIVEEWRQRYFACQEAKP